MYVFAELVGIQNLQRVVCGPLETFDSLLTSSCFAADVYCRCSEACNHLFGHHAFQSSCFGSWSAEAWAFAYQHSIGEASAALH